jgi:localization factor PodJL
MSAGAPHSTKGLDPRTRQAAADLARQSGLSLNEWISQLMADEGPEDATSQDYFASSPAEALFVEAPRADRGAPSRIETPEHPADEVGRVTQALDRLSQRIEAAEHRSTLAISGVDQTVRGVLGRLDGAEREQTAVAARFEGAVQEVQFEQAKVADRLRRMEQEAVGPRSAEALRSLESALGKVAGHLYEGEGRTREALAEMASRVNQFETDRGESVVEAVVSRLGARLEEAEAKTSGALRDLRVSFAALDERINSVESRPHAAAAESRLEQLAANLTARVEASRTEMADKIQVTADSRFDRMDRTLAEMSDHVRAAESRSAQAIERMGREVIDLADVLGRKVQSVEHRSADAIEQVGGEVARIAQAVESKLTRSDSVQAQALERLGLEIARISERLAERIANSERRSAQAIDDVGEQVARVTERISQRHERASGELADRIRLSEERTAKLLEEAREKLERLAESQRRLPEPSNDFASLPDAEEALFAEQPFPAFQPPPAAETAFSSGPFHQTLRASPGFGAEPAAAPWTAAPEPNGFSSEDFQAADEFVSASLDDDETAQMAEDEALALSEPAVAAGPSAPAAYTAADFTPIDPPVAIAPAPEPALEPAPPPAPAVVTPVAEPFKVQALAADAEAPESVALSLREAVARARAAANAANQPARPVLRPPELAAETPADDQLFTGGSFGRAKQRTGPGPALGIGMAATFVVAAFGGYLWLQAKPNQTMPGVMADAVNTAKQQWAQLTGGPAVAARPSTPQLAVALSPQPITPQGPDATAPAATADLAAAYSAAVAKIELKDKSGVEDLRRTANLGYAPAQFLLGKLYLAGDAGLKKDPVEAWRWTERAAEGGDRQAMHNLALDYYQGAGVATNKALAAQWFQRAAELGLVDSQVNLGLIYEGGVGVPPNAAEAYKWYLIAERAGDSEARNNAARLRSTLTPDARTVAERAAAAFHAAAPNASTQPVVQAIAAPAGPVTAAAGDLVTAQKALSSLGYYQGPADGASSPALRLALSAYQHDQGLPATGAADPGTVSRLSAYVH